MVGHHRDQRAVLHPQLAQLVEHRGHDRVVEGDLAVVGSVCEDVAERVGGRVGLVGVVEVEPGEPGRLRRLLLLQPGAEGQRGAVAAPLRLQGEDLALHALHVVVVDVEPAGQAVAPVEDERADEGARVVAGVLERGGQGGQPVGHVEVAVVAHPVGGGEQAGEDRGVGGQGDGRGGVGGGEHHAVAGETVQVARLRLRVAVGADVVGAGGVEGDEEDVVAARERTRPVRGPDRRAGSPPRPGAGEHGEHGGHGGADQEETASRGRRGAWPRGRARRRRPAVLALARAPPAHRPAPRRVSAARTSSWRGSTASDSRRACRPPARSPASSRAKPRLLRATGVRIPACTARSR